MRASIFFFPWAAKKVINQKNASIYEGKFQRGKSRNKVKCRTEGDLLLWGEFTMRFKDRKHPLNGYLNALDKQYEDFRILNATSHSRYNAQDITDYIMDITPKEKISKPMLLSGCRSSISLFCCLL
jgi:hypothetical protein